MKTEFGLLAAFGDPIVPVADVCELFFDCKKNTAYQQIKAYTFPIPAFQLADNHRNEFYVTIEDLAKYVDLQLAESQQNVEQLFCLLLLAILMRQFSSNIVFNHLNKQAFS